MPLKTLSETAREREFYKYAEHYVTKAEHDSHLAPIYFCPQTTPLSDPDVAASSHDTSLTAFAQLGALRLNAKRCLISLFSRTQQFVIAEATQTLSLQSDTVHDAGDALWLGTTVLPKETAICKLVIDKPREASCTDDPTSLGVIVIPSLAEDARFSDMPFVTGGPRARFYAGVPICSPKGAHIGSYCVMDDVPRKEMGPVHIQFMKDMAITIMAHLELTRAREEHRRGERMVRGLGSFVEGKSTLRQWRGGATVADRSYEKPASINVGEGQLNAQQQTLQKAQDNIVVSLDSLDRHRSDNGSVSAATDLATYQTVSTRSTARTRSAGALMLDDVASPYRTPDSSPSRSPQPHVPSREASADLQESILSVNVKQTFSRAANIIRESLEVEGAIFLDASIGSFGGMVSDHSSASEGSESPSASSSGGESHKKSGRNTPNETDKMSGILGFATSDDSSINGDLTSNVLPIPEKFLKGLLRRYPKGKIYYFDESGRISSDSSGADSPRRTGRPGYDATHTQVSDTSSHKRRVKARKFSRFSEGETLIRLFPSARCVALVPLWDNHRERWFSGGLVWTNTPKRVFTSEGELSYLAVFSSSIMAEVARLDASTSDKAKTDLLGSISHELRSPLHGILGSVEMLEDSVVNAFQGNMVHTIETCGRTLLDTIDHLLDFTKINHFMEVSARHRKLGAHTNTQSAPRSKLGRDMLAMSAQVQLDIVTEEVVAAVSAGYDTQTRAKLNSRPKLETKRSVHGVPVGAHDQSYSSDRFGDGNGDSTVQSLDVNGVIVILDIDKNVNWAFQTQAGAWRRIVMNLFANALKYTDDGYIRISLKAKPLVVRYGLARSKIVLTVSDSGKGMSRDYLRGRLFQPFAQEDRLAPGTGLGLSIIRQIIVSQGGKIDVQSVKGEGTKVTVELPLNQAQKDLTDTTVSELTTLSMVQETTKTLSACLIGVENKVHVKDAKLHPKIFCDGADGPQTLKSSLQGMCNDWFGLNLDTARQAVQQSDLYLVVETPFNSQELASGELLKDIPLVSPRQLQPIVIVLCRSASSAYALSSPSRKANYQGRIIEHIAQPCGPRKLAKALSLCFERQQASTPFDLLSPTTARFIVSQFDGESPPYDLPSASSNLSGFQFDSDDNPLSPLETPTMELESMMSTTRPSVDDRSSSDSSILTPQSSSSDLDVKRPGPFLIVDDNHINLRILAAYLKKNDHPYQMAEDGSKAFAVYKANPAVCRIIFMDISMPVTDGLTSTRLIRAYERLHKLAPATIILLTGLASASVQQEAKASGADMFLTKPVRLKDLGLILRDLT